MLCAKNNPKTAIRLPQMGAHHRGTYLTEDWQIDFTQMPRATGNFRHLYLWTLSGWVEAYPTRTEKASKVAKVLLKEISP